jgi:hypothetical protein
MFGNFCKKIANFVMMGQKKHGNPNYNLLSASVGNIEN